MELAATDRTAQGRVADGGICLTINAAEGALRGVVLGRKAWLFAGSDHGGERAAFMYTLSDTAKLNDIYPQALLAELTTTSRTAQGCVNASSPDAYV